MIRMLGVGLGSPVERPNLAPEWPAQYRASANACFAMFSGSGLSEAERRIKHPTQGSVYAVSEELPLLRYYANSIAHLL